MTALRSVGRGGADPPHPKARYSVTTQPDGILLELSQANQTPQDTGASVDRGVAGYPHPETRSSVTPSEDQQQGLRHPGQRVIQSSPSSNDEAQGIGTWSCVSTTDYGQR